MNDARRLTIAIPFHRGLDYLRVAIESVRAQTVPDWQLVVADDRGEASSEAVEDLVGSFGDPRIRYRPNPHNLGMVANWNRCLELAETELVTLLHADDRLLPGYAATMLALADRHPEAVALFCGAQIIDAEGRPRFSLADAVKHFFVPGRSGDVVLRGEDSLRVIMAGNFIMCPTLCLRRPVLGARRFEETWRQVQDLELTSRLLLEDETLVGTREVAYAYRRHPENATARQSESLLRFDEEFALFAGVAERAARRGWPRAASVSQRASIVRLHLAYRALRDLLALRFDAAGRELRCLVRRGSGTG